MITGKIVRPAQDPSVALPSMIHVRGEAVAQLHSTQSTSTIGGLQLRVIRCLQMS